MSSRHRNGYIDLLRGISIIAVLLLHFTLAFGLKNSPIAALLGKDFAAALLFNGNYGVTLFFVVSGFLITSMSISRWGSLARIDPWSFYVYRFARIMPSLVLALAVIVVLGCFDVPFFTNSDGGHHLPASYFVIAVASVLTFWHNVLMQSVGWFNYCLNIYWSLSVEEVFYLALPIVCLTFRRTWLLVFACIAVCCYAPCYRAIHIDEGLYWECGYAACFDSIAIGCLAALLARNRVLAPMHAKALRVVALLVIALLYLRGIDGHEVFGFTEISVCTALYLLASTRREQHDSLALRMTWPLRWFGRHSYELYLFHIVILALMRNVYARGELPPLGWALWLVLFVTCSAASALVVARYYSDPANRAIRRHWSQWFHSTSTKLDTATRSG